MPDRAEGARAVLRLVEILGESWMDFANRQQIRAPSGFSRLGRVELPWGLGGVTVGIGWSYRGGHTYSHQITLPQCSPVSGSFVTIPFKIFRFTSITPIPYKKGSYNVNLIQKGSYA